MICDHQLFFYYLPPPHPTPGNSICFLPLSQMPGKDMAMLCCKVENLVVGAPCGTMDQVSGGCGRLLMGVRVSMPFFLEPKILITSEVGEVGAQSVWTLENMRVFLHVVPWTRCGNKWVLSLFGHMWTHTSNGWLQQARVGMCCAHCILGKKGKPAHVL